MISLVCYRGREEQWCVRLTALVNDLFNVLFMGCVHRRLKVTHKLCTCAEENFSGDINDKVLGNFISPVHFFLGLTSHIGVDSIFRRALVGAQGNSFWLSPLPPPQNPPLPCTVEAASILGWQTQGWVSTFWRCTQLFCAEFGCAPPCCSPHVVFPPLSPLRHASRARSLSAQPG